MRFIIVIILLFLVNSVHAEITFFDNPDENFIIGNSSAIITGEITEQPTGRGICTNKWNCTNWGGRKLAWWAFKTIR